MPEETKLHRALFLDRDGVINQEGGYLYKIEDVFWVDGIFALAATAARLGYKLVVVTNQAGIGRGLYTEEQFQTLMQWMREQFLAQGVELTAVYHAPHHPEHGIGHYRRESEDRKPSPGMLRRAAHDLALDLSQCVMVGDRCTDIAAANAAGLRQAFLIAGTEQAPCSGSFLPVSSHAEVEQWLLTNTPA